MIYGIVGKYYLTDGYGGSNPDIIAGNGKTATVTYYCHLNAIQGRRVITNYHTSFEKSPFAKTPEFRMPEYMDAQDILDGFFDRPNVCYGLTEAQKFMNSVGEPTRQKAWVEGLMSQRRKLQTDIFYDSQRIMSFDNRLREHTGVWLVPHKYHFDDWTICQNEDCMWHHYISVNQESPFILLPIAVFDAAEIGQYYNTNEIIKDTLIAPEKLKKQQKQKEKYTEPEKETEVPIETVATVMKKRRKTKLPNLDGLTEKQRLRALELAQGES